MLAELSWNKGEPGTLHKSPKLFSLSIIIYFSKGTILFKVQFNWCFSLQRKSIEGNMQKIKLLGTDAIF